MRKAPPRRPASEDWHPPALLNMPAYSLSGRSCTEGGRGKRREDPAPQSRALNPRGDLLLDLIDQPGWVRSPFAARIARESDRRARPVRHRSRAATADPLERRDESLRPSGDPTASRGLPVRIQDWVSVCAENESGARRSKREARVFRGERALVRIGSRRRCQGRLIPHQSRSMARGHSGAL